MKDVKSFLSSRYIIKQTIGKGAFSTVYLAEDIATHEERAIKVMDLLDVPEKEQGFHYDLFLRESQMLQQLSHPGIPKLYEFFIEENLMIMVCEYVRGIDLDTYIEKHGGPLDEEEVLDIFIQVCQILEYLHSDKPAGIIIYRDLKPANIILDENGKVKLIDFATARIFDPKKKCDTIRLGTPGYAAPEAYGTQQTDVRADVFSVGASMFHLLTNEDPEKYMFQYPPLRKKNPKLSVYIQDIVLETLKPKEERTPNITILKDRLKALRDTLVFMRKFSVRSIFFRIMFSILQLFRMKFSYKPSRDFIKVGILLFVLCLITPAIVVYLFIKFPPHSIEPVFDQPPSVGGEVPASYQRKKLITVVDNKFSNFQIYCELERWEEAGRAWREFISFASPYPEPMKKKFDYYPQSVKLMATSGKFELISEVFRNVLSEYERYMKGENMGDPSKDISEIALDVYDSLSLSQFVEIMNAYIRETPVINYSRKIFVIHRAVTALEREVYKEKRETVKVKRKEMEKEPGLDKVLQRSETERRAGNRADIIKAERQILTRLIEYKAMVDEELKKTTPIFENLNIKSFSDIDMLFIRGELARLDGKRNESLKYYKEYLYKINEQRDPGNESYRETFREKLFVEDARRRILEFGCQIPDTTGH